MKNCREYCGYRKLCAMYYSNFKGEEGLLHSECPMAWKIEDILMDAEDIRKEQEQDEEEIPFCEDYDGPEVLE